MTQPSQQFVFIDQGQDGDQPVVVGPFPTENAAAQAAGGREVTVLWTNEQFLDSQNLGRDETAAADRLTDDERASIAAGVREAGAQLDGTTASVVSMLSGLTRAELDEVGGVPEEFAGYQPSPQPTDPDLHRHGSNQHSHDDGRHFHNPHPNGTIAPCPECGGNTPEGFDPAYAHTDECSSHVNNLGL